MWLKMNSFLINLCNIVDSIIELLHGSWSWFIPGRLLCTSIWSFFEDFQQHYLQLWRFLKYFDLTNLQKRLFLKVFNSWTFKNNYFLKVFKIFKNNYFWRFFKNKRIQSLRLPLESSPYFTLPVLDLFFNVNMSTSTLF